MDKKIIWKFNLIDLIIIAVIILSLVALLYKVTLDSGEESEAFEFVCVCDEAPAELLYGIQTDAECIDGNSGEYLGSVSFVSTEPLPDKPDKVKGTVSLIAEGVRTEHGISVGDSVYLKGTTLPLVVGDTIFDVYISDIR